jgi:hypothetical protein
VDNFTRPPELVRACRLPVIEKLAEVTAMQAYQWFLLGMTVVLMPGVLVLVLMLWRSNSQNSADNRTL